MDLSEQIGQRAKEERRKAEFLTKGVVTDLYPTESPPKVRIDGRLMPIIHPGGVTVGDVIVYFNIDDPLALGKIAETLTPGCDCTPVIQESARKPSGGGFYAYSGDGVFDGIADNTSTGHADSKLAYTMFGVLATYGGTTSTSTLTSGFTTIPTEFGSFHNQTYTGLDYYSVIRKEVGVGNPIDYVIDYTPNEADTTSMTYFNVPGASVELTDIATSKSTTAGSKNWPKVNVVNDGDLVIYAMITGLYTTTQSYFAPDPYFEQENGKAGLRGFTFDVIFQRDFSIDPEGRKLAAVKGTNDTASSGEPADEQHARQGQTAWMFYERTAAAASSPTRTGWFSHAVPKILITASFSGVHDDLGVELV